MTRLGKVHAEALLVAYDAEPVAALTAAGSRRSDDRLGQHHPLVEPDFGG